MKMKMAAAGKEYRADSRSKNRDRAGGRSENRNRADGRSETRDREGSRYKDSKYKDGYKQRRRTRRKKLFGYAKKLVLVVLLLSSFVIIKEKVLTDTVGFSLDFPGYDRDKGSVKNLDGLYSPCAVLMDLSDGRIIAEHNGRDRIYPASLTKIMTAILAVENTENMEEVAAMPVSMFNKLYAEGASMAGFQPGEEVKLKDMLYGILLPSGAECCIAFAERIAGSEEAFVEMMNQKAEELGMHHTHFCNSTGLQDEEHYSTAEDIAVLLQYALRNDAFRAVFVSENHRVEPTEEHPEGFVLESTMFKELGDEEIPGGAILGGKTGYTDEAGLCLASLAEVNGKEYVLVTAGAEGSHDTKPYHVLDAIAVYRTLGE